MASSKRLSITCLLALLGGVTGGVSPAYSAAPQDLKPTSDWSITKIEASQNNSGAYCTLSRQYANGLVLTLGRNMTEEYSLAVDFRKERFDVDNPYTITLQPGPGQIRSFEMMPVSPSAMVVRLGWDDTFFAALKKSKNLKMGISGEEYNFALSDIDSGQSDLTSCLKGLKTASAEKVADIAPASGGTDVLSAEAGKKDESFAARKVKNETAKTETPVVAQAPVIEPPLKTAPAISTTVAVPSEPVAAKVPAPDVSQQKKIAELEKSIQTLTQQNTTLMQDLTAKQSALEAVQKELSMAKAPAPAPVPSVSVAEMDQLRQKLTMAEQDLKAKTTAFETAQATISAQKTEIDGLKSKPAPQPQMASKMSPAAEKELADLKKTLADITRQKEQLTQDLTAKQSALDSAQKALTAPKAPAAPAGVSVEAGKIAELEKSITRLTQDAAAKQSALDAALKANAEKDAALSSALKQIEQISAQQKDQSSKTVSSAQNEAQALQKAKQDLEALQAQKTALEQKVSAYKAEADRARLELNNQQASVTTRADQTASIQLQLEKLKNQLSLKETEARTYRNQLMTLQQNMASADTVSAGALNEMTPAAGAATIVPKPQVPTPSPAKPPVTKTSLAPSAPVQPSYQYELANTLKKAGITLNDQVRQGASTAGVDVYSWKANNLHGRAEVAAASAGGDLKRFMARHIDAAKSRCAGDFAAMPSAQNAGKTFYEVACVTPSGNTAASVVFFEQKGRYVAVSHETNAEDMDTAMEIRDRFAGSLN